VVTAAPSLFDQQQPALLVAVQRVYGGEQAGSLDKPWLVVLTDIARGRNRACAYLCLRRHTRRERRIYAIRPFSRLMSLGLRARCAVTRNGA
jgi:hypothetical protein